MSDRRDGSQPEESMLEILQAVSREHRTAAELSAITGLSMRSVRRFTLELRSRRALEMYPPASGSKKPNLSTYGLPEKREYPHFSVGSCYRWHPTGTRPDEVRRLAA